MILRLLRDQLLYPTNQKGNTTGPLWLNQDGMINMLSRPSCNVSTKTCDDGKDR